MMRPEIGLELVRLRVDDLSGGSGAGGTTGRPPAARSPAAGSNVHEDLRGALGR